MLYNTRCSQQNNVPGLQVLEIFEIFICQIFGFSWLPKVTSTHNKWTTEHDGDGENHKVYIKITGHF